MSYLTFVTVSYLLLVSVPISNNVPFVDGFSINSGIRFSNQRKSARHHYHCNHWNVSRSSRLNRHLVRLIQSSDDDYSENIVDQKRTKKRLILRKNRPTQKQSQEDDYQSDSNDRSKIVDTTIFTKLQFKAYKNHNDDMGFLHPETKRALTEDLKVTHMTQVQARTFEPIAIDQNDVVVKARTGTGKTLAFLLPSLHQIIEQQNMNNIDPNAGVDILIVSPTRELASQIADVAKQLTKYHHQVPVQSMVGGTSMGRDRALFQRETPRILVVTPGRLMDHLQPPTSNNQQQSPNKKTNTMYTKALSNVKILILDEADRLLTSANFAKEIQQILSYIPRPKQRQTLLFSATLSPSMLSLKNNDQGQNNRDMVNHANKSNRKKKHTYIKNLLKDDAIIIDCDDNSIIVDNETSGDSVKKQAEQQKPPSSKGNNNRTPILNKSVDHSYIILPNYHNFVRNVIHILEDTINSTNDKNKDDGNNKERTENKKIIVFFPTARWVGFMKQVLSSYSSSSFSSLRIFEMHSKKSQGFRTKTSQAFQKCKQGILLTSDVSARGVDYQDVTDVIQFGLPESRNQYIHRLGRTARAGKQGNGLLVLFPFERKFVQRELNGLDISRNEQLERQQQEEFMTSSSVSHFSNHELLGTNNKNFQIAAQQAYVAFLGYYVDQIRRTNIKSKEELVQIANEMATHVFCLQSIPPLSQQMVAKMRLKNIPGIVVSNEENNTL